MPPGGLATSEVGLALTLAVVDVVAALVVPLLRSFATMVFVFVLLDAFEGTLSGDVELDLVVVASFCSPFRLRGGGWLVRDRPASTAAPTAVSTRVTFWWEACFLGIPMPSGLGLFLILLVFDAEHSGFFCVFLRIGDGLFCPGPADPGQLCHREVLVPPTVFSLAIMAGCC